MTRLCISGMVGAALLAAACTASAAGHVRISLAAKPSSLTAGRAWTATLTARPRSFAGLVRVAGDRAGQPQHPRDGRPRHLPCAPRLPGRRAVDAHRPRRWLDLAPRDGHCPEAGGEAQAADVHLADVDRRTAGRVAARGRERQRTTRPRPARDGPAHRRRVGAREAVRRCGDGERNDLPLERRLAPAHRGHRARRRPSSTRAPRSGRSPSRRAAPFFT